MRTLKERFFTVFGLSVWIGTLVRYIIIRPDDDTDVNKEEDDRDYLHDLKEITIHA